MRTPESFKKPEVMISKVDHEFIKNQELKNRNLDLNKIKYERKIEESAARFEALELAKSSNEQLTKDEKSDNHQRPLIHITRKSSFNKTMSDIRFEMTESQRLGSKIIHNQIVERISDVAAKTLVRPLPILFGGFFALSFSSIVYIIAKNTGFELSGFETAFGFMFGWLFGLAVDYLRILISGKR